MNKSNTNPPRTQERQDDVDSRQLGDDFGALHTAGNEMGALRLVNQRLLRELAELTRQVQRLQEAQQAHEDRNTIPQEEQQHLSAPRDVDGGGKNSWTRGHDPYIPPGDDHNEGMLGQNDGGDEPTPYQQGKGEQSWEQRFQEIPQELSHMKEAVKGRAPVSMDALVQKMESPFTVGVLHFPFLIKFIMPQIEAFDETKDLVDHLNTYKNQMELHGYQDPMRCRAFAITLKGSALAWFNRLLPTSISSFKEISIAFVFHFIGARTYRKPSYHLLTIKQGP